MAQVGSLVVDLIAQTASFNANIEKAAANLNSNAAKMNKSLQQIEHGIKSSQEAAKLFAEAFVIEKGAEAIKGSLEYAASLGVVSKQLGVTSHDLQLYRFEAAQVGVSQEDMDKGLQKLTKSLGEAKLGAEAPSKAFAALSKVIGVDIVGTSKTAGDALPLIAKSFEKITDPVKQGAIDIALFGKAGQQLAPLLGAGSAKIDELAASFKNLGIELTPQQSERAHEAEIAFGNLERVLQARLASTVIENADAIVKLATSLTDLSIGIGKFMGSNPSQAYAILGSLAGLEIGSKFGVIGAVTGVLGGAVIGGGLGARGTPEGIREQLAGNTRNLEPYLRNPAMQSAPLFKELLNTRRDLKRQLAEATAVIKPEVKPPASGGGLPNFLAPPTHSKLEPKLFTDQNAKLDEQLLRMKQQQATDADTIARFAKEQINVEADKFAQDVKLNLTAGHLTDAQAKQLLAKNETVRAEELLRAELERQHQLALDAVELSTAANDNERDILQSLGAVAKTAGERQAIALRVLALDQQDERNKLNAIVADQLAADTEKKKARDRLARLDEIYADRAKAIQIQNAGPLQNYLDALPKTIAQIAEAMQNLRVNQFEALNQRTKQFADDFSDAFGHAAQDILDLKNPLDVLKSLVSDLAHQFQQEFIIRPLTQKIHDAIGAPLAEKLVTDKIGGVTTHGIASEFGLNAQQMNLALSTSTGELVQFSAALQSSILALGANMTPDSISGGGGGLLGSLVKVGSSFFGGAGVDGLSSDFLKAATTDLTTTIPMTDLSGLLPKFASGGRPRGLSLVGEQGPELFMPDAPGTIIPAGSTASFMRSIGNMRPANDGRPVMGPVHFHFPGVRNERDARISGQQAAAAYQREIAKAVRTGKAG